MIKTISLDIRGQICPSCLLLTLKQLNQSAAAVRGGEAEVVVVTDDRQATSTIPTMAERMGYRQEVTRLDGEAGLYRIRIFGSN